MQIAFVGLGKMGGHMARRAMGAHEVWGWDRDPAVGALLAKEGVRPAASLEALVQALHPPRAVWVMVPAGAAVDESLERLGALCGPGDVLVDGGNSLYRDSIVRAERLAERGIHLLDVGTSGGVWGLERGYCLMVGGEAGAFRRIEPLLATLAAEGGYAHLGPSGAGHFCKMVHNGIEYGLMQAYAEGFALMEASPFNYDLGAAASVWNRGSVVRSWLLELAEGALAEDPSLERVAPWVDDTGEGRWTIQAALDHAVPIPAIAASLFARFRSRLESNFADRLLATLRHQFGGHATRTRTRKTP